MTDTGTGWAVRKLRECTTKADLCPHEVAGKCTAKECVLPRVSKQSHV